MWESESSAVKNSCDDRPAANNGLCRTIDCFSTRGRASCVLMNRLGTKTRQLSKLEVREADGHRRRGMLWQGRSWHAPFRLGVRLSSNSSDSCTLDKFRIKIKNFYLIERDLFEQDLFLSIGFSALTTGPANWFVNPKEFQICWVHRNDNKFYLNIWN